MAIAPRCRPRVSEHQPFRVASRKKKIQKKLRFMLTISDDFKCVWGETSFEKYLVSPSGKPFFYKTRHQLRLLFLLVVVSLLIAPSRFMTNPRQGHHDSWSAPKKTMPGKIVSNVRELLFYKKQVSDQKKSQAIKLLCGELLDLFFLCGYHQIRLPYNIWVQRTGLYQTHIFIQRGRHNILRNWVKAITPHIWPSFLWLQPSNVFLATWSPLTWTHNRVK